MNGLLSVFILPENNVWQSSLILILMHGPYCRTSYDIWARKKSDWRFRQPLCTYRLNWNRRSSWGLMRCMRWHCPPDAGFQIRVLTVTATPHNTEHGPRTRSKPHPPPPPPRDPGSWHQSETWQGNARPDDKSWFVFTRYCCPHYITVNMDNLQQNTLTIQPPVPHIFGFLFLLSH